MLPRSKRLSREGFDHLARARRLTSDHFSLSYTESNKVGGFGIVITKKIAPLSVTRYKMKRQIRSILAEYDHNGRSIVVFVRKGAPKIPFDQIKSELSSLLQSILKSN